MNIPDIHQIALQAHELHRSLYAVPQQGRGSLTTRMPDHHTIEVLMRVVIHLLDRNSEGLRSIPEYLDKNLASALEPLGYHIPRRFTFDKRKFSLRNEEDLRRWQEYYGVSDEEARSSLDQLEWLEKVSQHSSGDYRKA